MLVNMFSVPLITYEIADWHIAKKKILDALPAECPKYADPEEGCLFTDFFINNEVGVTTLPDYSDTVLDIIKPYLADFFGGTEVQLTDMWYQKYSKGVRHSFHNHGHSGWSSIIYVEFDPEKHQATRFMSPFNNIWNGNIEMYTPPVNEGDMIIFPSTIAHEAPANKSDTRRTIVSYNMQGHIEAVKKTLFTNNAKR